MKNRAGSDITRLARRLALPSEERWDPDTYEEYETRVFAYVNRAEKEKVLELIDTVVALAEEGGTHPAYALYPLLIAFQRSFGGSSSLWLEAYYSAIGAGGMLSDRARELLVRAYEQDPNDPHVLWALWKDHTAPWFPRQLILADDPVDHEKECLRRILRSDPDDELAGAILLWTEEHGRQYAGSRDVPITIHEIDASTRPSSIRSLRKLLAEVGP